MIRLRPRKQSRFGRPGQSGPSGFAFNLFKASAREFHQSKLVSSNNKAPADAGSSTGRGLVTVYFGANSVASALNPLRDRDAPENYPYSKPHLSGLASKPDISTWQRIGHFYLALTPNTKRTAIGAEHRGSFFVIAAFVSTDGSLATIREVKRVHQKVTL